MSPDTRSVVRKNFSLSEKVAGDIDRYADENDLTKSKVVEMAVDEFVNGDREAQLERKINEIHERVVEQGDTFGDPAAHTHSDVHTEDTRDKTPESDGGTATAPNSDPAVFDSIADYLPEYPTDRTLSRKALREVPDAGDDLEIDPDHVDFTTLRSRGMNVSTKAAVCAAIIRHEHDGILSERAIKHTAKDVFGTRRSARRHYEEVTSHFVAHPTEHPDISDSDLSVFEEYDKSILKDLGCTIEDSDEEDVEDTYAPSLEYVSEVYHERDYGRIIEKLSEKFESEPTEHIAHSTRAILNGLWNSRGEYETYVSTLDDFTEVYLKLLENHLEIQDEVGIDVTIPSPYGDVSSLDELKTAKGDGE